MYKFKKKKKKEFRKQKVNLLTVLEVFIFATRVSFVRYKNSNLSTSRIERKGKEGEEKRLDKRRKG